ncbi:unnamed protein product [Eruca vesicaria subsp. sativa]|uniref:Uncharacterized protein n=1 Tax=Eruca vesicaria subsp. sativa TaxID=29727 RepID=A0ABC8IYA3_ERUVS|nr:unnamed protein product [Eruca vesicaria subsp. sativa]
MEAVKKMMVVSMIVAVAFSAVGQVAAATVEAPAPSPTSDAAMFVPALFASVVALASVPYGAKSKDKWLINMRNRRNSNNLEFF